MRGDYFKASCDLPQSSLWAEDAETCKLWITILAMKDREHVVTKNIVGLSHAARIPIERCKEIIVKFLSPDPYSTTPDHEGRRLQEVEGGYLVLNGEKYRELGWSDDKKAYERDRKQKYRKKIKPATEPKSTRHADARAVLRLLNTHSGKSFREVDSNLAIISARLSEKGVELEGVKTMIARQCKRWLGTSQEEYLRPETLFAKSKFDGYYASRDLPINEANTSSRQPGNPRNEGCAPNTTDYEKAVRSRSVGSQVASPELPLS